MGGKGGKGCKGGKGDKGGTGGKERSGDVVRSVAFWRKREGDV
jgi:hypothetical protein